LGLGGFLPEDSKWQVPVSESKVAASADMMAAGDAFIESVGRVRQDTELLGMNVNDTGGSGELWPGMAHTAAKRHRGRLNIVFCDGHVEPPRVAVLFDRKDPTTLRRWKV